MSDSPGQGGGKAASNSQKSKDMNDSSTSLENKQDKQDWIGANLKRVYDEALNEPVPDRLLSLLKEIEKKDSESS